MISKKDIEHLASLSKLQFSDSELEDFGKDFQNILQFVDKINEKTIESNLENNNIINIDDLRDDIVKNSYDTELLLSNAPHKKDGCFKVFKVVE